MDILLTIVYGVIIIDAILFRGRGVDYASEHFNRWNEKPHYVQWPNEDYIV